MTLVPDLTLGFCDAGAEFNLGFLQMGFESEHATKMPLIPEWNQGLKP